MIHDDYPHWPGDLPGCAACDRMAAAVEALDAALAAAKAAADDARRALADDDNPLPAERLALRIIDTAKRYREARYVAEVVDPEHR